MKILVFPFLNGFYNIFVEMTLKSSENFHIYGIAPPERSRSRPDTVPSRGPAVSNYKELGSRCGSPIDTMELKSKFG